MMKINLKGFFKFLALILAFTMLVAAPMGGMQAYALEGKQPTETESQGELLLGTSSETYGIYSSEQPLVLPNTGESDTVPPAFGEGNPVISPQSSGSRQIYVILKAQEPAYFHAVLLQDNADVPSKEQVREGKAANGDPALNVFSNSSKYTDISIVGFVPQHDTDYDVYVVLRDDNNNLSEPKKIDFHSPPAADYIVAGYPQTGEVQPDGSRQVQIKINLQNIGSEKKGKVYWVLLPDGASAPSIEQIEAGTDGEDNVGVVAGSPEFTTEAEESFLVTGASGNTQYDLHMVVGNTNYFNPLGNCTDVIKLEITTPADITGEKVCAIGTTEYDTLSEALTVAGSTATTIKLLKSFTIIQGVYIDNQKITFDLNGHTLNIEAIDTGLMVINGTVALTGNGALNVSGKLRGVCADVGSNVTVTNATATDTGSSGIGVFALNGSKVTVRGDAVGSANGVRADSIRTEVTVDGNVSNSAQNRGAVYSGEKAKVTVAGDVTSTMGYGVHVFGGSIAVNGNVSGSHVGAMVMDTDAEIVVKGNLSSYQYGVIIYSGNGSITVDGEIKSNSSDPITYVLIGNKEIKKEEGIADPEKSGYLKYSDSTEGITGMVWVKDGALVAKYSLTVENGTGGGDYEEGDTVSITANPAPNGKVFDKWTTTDGVSFADVNKVATTITMPAKAVMVKATYKDKPVTIYTVTFDANGGTITPTSMTTGMDGKVTSLPAATRTGSYSFDGWYTIATGGTKVTTSTVFTANTTIYAHWAYIGGGDEGSGSSGSSESMTTTYYSISIYNEIENGEISFDKSKAAEGSKVTITVTPERRYILDTIRVFDKDGKRVKLTENKNDTFTFTMPKRNVEVEVSFIKEIIEPEILEIPYTMYFTDIKEGDWYYESIRYINEKGLMKGTSDTTFSPNEKTNRAMIVTILYRLEENPITVGNYFTDIPLETWYSDAASWGSINEIVKGYGNGLFGPSDNITREQLVLILYNYAKYKGYNTYNITSLHSFTDSGKISNWAKEAMNWAVGSSIISGKGNNTLEPTNTATRAEVATMIQRFIEKIVK